jgi:hypothetical protein
MRNLILLASLTAATPAAAQPITSPASCKVTISRAPEDVRAVVEEWVTAEPRCASSVDVRIIPTEGGLYILAQDDRGGVRERIVPDAQSAGVLIASWIADDTFPPDKTVVFVPELVPPATSTRAETTASPSSALVDRAPSPRTPGKLPKWVSVGLMFDIGPDRGGGFRAEVDVKSWIDWSAGIALSRSFSSKETGEFGGYTAEDFTWVTATDTKAVGYLGRTLCAGRWQLRGQLGAGVVWTQAAAYIQRRAVYSPVGGATYTGEDSKLSPTAEAALLASVRLGHWALHVGPVFTAYAQTLRATELSSWEPMTETIDRHAIETLLWTGLRHSL